MESNNTQQIRELLDAYFRAETTVEQEKELRAYFDGERSVPQDLLYAQAMFCSFAEQAAQVCPKRDGVKKGVRRVFTMWRVISVVAALVAVTLTLTFTLSPSLRSALPSDKEVVVYCYINGVPITDYDQAVEYTSQILGFMANRVTKPAEYLAPLELFSQSMLQLRQLTDLSEYVNSADYHANDTNKSLKYKL